MFLYVIREWSCLKLFMLACLVVPNSYKNTALWVRLLTFCISLEAKYSTINLSGGDFTHTK